MNLLQHLREQLNSINIPSCVYIAYSGGLDSHVLLHGLTQLRRQIPGLSLQAMHVHHGLSPHADEWVKHCRMVCEALQVEFHCEYLDSAPGPGESVEAWAREARYAVFAKKLPAGNVLLTAHTQDDQAETVLLQLLRGSGPKGLAAMPQNQIFFSGRLLRPLLNLSRRQLHEYAIQQNLIWLEDESNIDQRFDRNFLRHRVMPLLRERWPGTTKNISRSASHCAEAAAGLSELARIDLGGHSSALLPLELLRALSPPRQRNLLRHWLKDSGCRLPNTRHIQRIQQDLINGRVDSQPQVSWDGWVIRRYRQSLMVEAAASTVKMDECIAWDLSAPLPLPERLGELVAVQQVDGGISLRIDPRRLNVRFRRGGERCRLTGKNQTAALKKLFQQWGVPPWQRSTIPLLYQDDELVAVIGYAICAPFAAAAGETGWKITIRSDFRAA